MISGSFDLFTSRFGFDATKVNQFPLIAQSIGGIFSFYVKNRWRSVRQHLEHLSATDVAQERILISDPFTDFDWTDLKGVHSMRFWYMRR